MSRRAFAPMPAAELPISGTERAKAGCIVTAREQESGECVVLHRVRPTVLLAVAAVCDVLDELDGDWRVLTVSTPPTIYRDLQGTRQSERTDELHRPEADFLGKIGRTDLLDESLAPRLKRGTKRG